MFEQNEIITIKMISGEEIVCRFIENTDNTLIVTKMRTITLHQQGLALIPYIMSIPENAEIEVGFDKIIMVYATEREVSDAFIEHTSNLKIVR